MIKAQILLKTKKLDKILEFTAVTGLIISASLAIIAVFLRYFLGISYQVIEEICRYTIIYGAFAYIGPLIKKGEHLKIAMLSDRLSGKLKHFNNLLISIILLASFIYLFWSSVNWFISLVEMNVKTMSGTMLLAIPVFSVPLGMFFGCLYSIIQLIQDMMNITNTVTSVDK